MFIKYVKYKLLFFFPIAEKNVYFIDICKNQFDLGYPKNTIENLPGNSYKLLLEILVHLFVQVGENYANFNGLKSNGFILPESTESNSCFLV